MKLLIITSISEFKEEVKQILKKGQVKSYSYREVTGYRDITEESIENNWFGTEMNGNVSIMFYAFVPKTNVDIVYSSIVEFNNKQDTLSQIHLAVLSIEK